MGQTARPEWSSPRRYAVLVCFAFTAALNGFMFQDFSTVAKVSKEILDCDDDALEWLYSSSLVTVCLCIFAAVWGLIYANWSTNLANVLLNTLAAWLRYVAVQQGSYLVAQLSSVMLGASAAVIVCSFAQVGALWFAPRQRSVAIALAVQSSYLGWALGALIPIVATDAASMRSFCLAQALVVSVSVPLFFFGYGLPACAADAAADVTHDEALSPRESFWRLARSPSYVTYTLCFAVVGGASFSIPAVQDLILSDCSDQALAHSATKWTNLTFILSGVAGGVLLGTFAREERHYRQAVAACFVAAALALVGLAVLTVPAVLRALSSDTLFALLVPLMAVAGVGSIGFVSLGLRIAVQVAEPVSEVYSGGVVEWWIQMSGVVFTQLSTCSIGFTATAAGTVASAVVMLCTLRWWAAPGELCTGSCKSARLLDSAAVSATDAPGHV